MVSKFSYHFLLKTKFLTHGQCAHYVNRVVNCLIFGLPVEEYFWIHIEHYGDELIEVFYGICIADHFSTSNWAEILIQKIRLTKLTQAKVLFSPYWVLVRRNISNSILVV